MATQWALPSSEAVNSRSRSPPIGSSAWWWCTVPRSLSPHGWRRLVHVIAVLRPDLVFAFFNVAKLPGTHRPEEYAPRRHRHEKGAEEHVEGYIHLDSFLDRGKVRDLCIPRHPHDVVQHRESGGCHQRLRRNDGDEAQEHPIRGLAIRDGSVGDRKAE